APYLSEAFSRYASGQKMGKSEGNSLWLDPHMTSPYDYFQYWINTDDADVRSLLYLYTFLPGDQIEQLTAESGEALREAKRVLAYESTALTHGRAAADEAMAASSRLFGASATLDAADTSLPTVEIPRAGAEALTIADIFVLAGLATSRGDARRTAAQGGLTLDDARVTDVDSLLGNTDPHILRAGKKRFTRVAFID
ncbi:MAG TPA: tyrosine--tRNA ligase, partial [Thermomicrobiales bacterium]|nr:tyrosine--tRNA ligase [Thermomicrobiales bacterium]